jgi:hypothetical protein
LNISFPVLISFQFFGSVHVMPCSSQLTVCPPWSASVCADVGFGRSTCSLLLAGALDPAGEVPPDVDELEVEFEFEVELESDPLLLVSLFVRLHNESASVIAMSTGIFFIGSIHLRGLKEHARFYDKSRDKSMALRIIHHGDTAGTEKSQ